MDETALKTAINELKIDLVKFNYVFARSDGFSVEESAKKAKRSKSWFYAMPKEDQEYLEMIAGELNAAAKIRAKQILEDAVVEAARVKVAGLKNSNARIKQDAATEILDRNGFKATQPIDLTTGGEKIEPVKIIEVVKDHGK